ncbi:MAG: NlpC/P60 family protein, partial [Candidatus Gracilibacteria bacterium]|nr:NlpC/P60 family protein [Candidatus Gracilibacteria bacterium]
SEQGIDCSAFVQRYFWEVKGILLPKYSQDQKSFCSGKVERNELQNDDLVFLHSRKKHISHVGIVRGTKVWHSGLKMGVMEEDLAELERRYVLEGFWRIGHFNNGNYSADVATGRQCFWSLSTEGGRGEGQTGSRATARIQAARLPGSA